MLQRFVLVGLLFTVVAASSQTSHRTNSQTSVSTRLAVLSPQRRNSVLLNELLKRRERIVLNFVSISCQHSIKQLESIKSTLRRKSQDSNLSGDYPVFAIVFVGRNLIEIKRFLKGNRLPALVLWDDDGKLARSLKIKVTPTIAVLSRDFKLVKSYEGFTSYNPKAYGKFFERLIEAVTQGTLLPPRPAQLHGGNDNDCTLFR